MDYSVIDNSSLLSYLFYPRDYFTSPPENAFDMMTSVEQGVVIHSRFYQSERKGGPWILYFHGNGEVVCDYDDLAPYYNREGINVVVADYRGYGSSTGKPNFNHVANDAPIIFEAVKDKIEEIDPEYSGLWVMGRSLGSMPALLLANRYSDQLKGLIVESGFVSIVKLINHLNLPSPGDLTQLENEAKEKVKQITLPTLVIHGERDVLVPLDQGEEIYELVNSEDKRLFTIPRAGHNDIFFVETDNYIKEIKKFLNK
ncbi:alpha/beta hydrolase [Natranaerofaba carboxydovora]|uniref:alpha/beta hydrolase n=1 Tax=Natranaerofaba carboxydovora TaxID=2742683 RepID=UPI001F148F25|nr:alpha/beta fold hydrolase [Natranaerofaba carboxydovora]UMZ74277.1 Multifunctional-autoprocessing repeats-in-toxin [Natranaerofaba carboxydovora]